MINAEQVNAVRTTWLKASEVFCFEIVTPFSFEIDGITRVAFAYLPEYGSPNGVIIGLVGPPNYECDKHIKSWAELNDCFWSFLYIEGILTYDQAYFEEVLEDWGRYSSR